MSQGSIANDHDHFFGDGEQKFGISLLVILSVQSLILSVTLAYPILPHPVPKKMLIFLQSQTFVSRFAYAYLSISLLFCADGQHIVTVSHDRTIKLWSGKNIEKEEKMDTD